MYQPCDQLTTMRDYWLAAKKSEPGLVDEIWQHMTADCQVCISNRAEIAEYRAQLAAEAEQELEPIGATA